MAEVKKTIKQWLKEVEKNPEEFGVSASHIKKINREIKKIEKDG